MSEHSEQAFVHFAVRVDTDTMHFFSLCGMESDDAKEYVNGRNFLSPNLDKITCKRCKERTQA